MRAMYRNYFEKEKTTTIVIFRDFTEARDECHVTRHLARSEALLLIHQEAIQYVRDGYLFDVLCSYMHTSTLSSKSKCEDTTGEAQS